MALVGGIAVGRSGKAAICVLGCLAAAGLLIFLLIPKSDQNTPLRGARGAVASKPPSTLPAGPTTEAMKTEVVEVAQGLVENLPSDANAMALAARLYDGLGKSDGSTACWRECLKLAPKRADACSQLGWAAVKRGEFEQAALVLRRAVELNPRMPGAHHGLACALMSLGEHAEAISHFEKEVEIAPTAVLSQYMLGQARQQLGRYEAAGRNYHAVLKLDRQNKNALYGLANVLTKLGDKTQAAEYRRKYTELSRADLKSAIKEGESYDDRAVMRGLLISAHTQAGKIYAAARQGDNAQKHWRRAFAIDAGDIPSRMALAGWCQTAGKIPEALEICKELTTIQPDSGVHWINVGVLNARLSQPEAAEKALRTAIRVDPRNPGTHSALAVCFLHNRKNAPEARRLAHAAVTLDPSAANYALLARSHHANGDMALAGAAMKRAIEKDPANLRYKQILQAMERGR